MRPGPSSRIPRLTQAGLRPVIRPLNPSFPQSVSTSVTMMISSVCVLLAVVLAAAASPVDPPRLQVDLKAIDHHLSYIVEHSCHHPQPRTVHVHELLPPQQVRGKSFFPEVTLLHRCTPFAGCCEGSKKFVPLHYDKIRLPFKVTFLEDGGHHHKGEWQVEYYDFANHTVCHCDNHHGPDKSYDHDHGHVQDHAQPNHEDRYKPHENVHDLARLNHEDHYKPHGHVQDHAQPNHEPRGHVQDHAQPAHEDHYKPHENVQDHAQPNHEDHYKPRGHIQDHAQPNHEDHYKPHGHVQDHAQPAPEDHYKPQGYDHVPSSNGDHYNPRRYNQDYQPSRGDHYKPLGHGDHTPHQPEGHTPVHGDPENDHRSEKKPEQNNIRIIDITV